MADHHDKPGQTTHEYKIIRLDGLGWRADTGTRINTGRNAANKTLKDMIFRFEVKTEPAAKAAVGIAACVAISSIAVHQKSENISAVCVICAATVAYLTLRELNPAPARRNE